MPTQRMVVRVPFADNQNDARIFCSHGSQLRPTLTGWHGKPPEQGEETTLFLEGMNFSIHDTHVIAGGKHVSAVLVSRQLLEVTIPKDACPTPSAQGTALLDINVATPNGVSNHLLIKMHHPEPNRKQVRAESDAKLEREVRVLADVAAEKAKGPGKPPEKASEVRPQAPCHHPGALTVLAELRVVPAFLPLERAETAGLLRRGLHRLLGAIVAADGDLLTAHGDLDSAVRDLPVAHRALFRVHEKTSLNGLDFKSRRDARGRFLSRHGRSGWKAQTSRFLLTSAKPSAASLPKKRTSEGARAKFTAKGIGEVAMTGKPRGSRAQQLVRSLAPEESRSREARRRRRVKYRWTGIPVRCWKTRAR